MGTFSSSREMAPMPSGPISVHASSCRASQTVDSLSLVVPLAGVRGQPKVQLNDEGTEGFVWMRAQTNKGARDHAMDLSFEGSVLPYPQIQVNPKNITIQFKKTEPKEWLGLPNAKRAPAKKSKK